MDQLGRFTHEPWDLWSKALDQKHGDKAPHVVEPQAGETYRMRYTGKHYVKLDELFGIEESERDKVWRACREPEFRTDYMDQDKVFAELLAPTYGLAIFAVDDNDLIRDCFAVYNDWLAEYCSHQPKRLLGGALIHMEDPDWAVKELARVAKKGIRCAIINADTRPEWGHYQEAKCDKFWAAAEEADMPLLMHCSTGQKPDMFHITGDERNRIESKWIDAFAEIYERCGVSQGDPVMILSETMSRQLTVQTAELALGQLGARAYHLIVPSPHHAGPMPFRNSGTIDVLRSHTKVVAALMDADMVIDVTQESILYSAETWEVLASGTRLYCMGGDHPEILERLRPAPEHETQVKLGTKMQENAGQMRVTSKAGTDLTVDLTGSETDGVWGWHDRDGQLSHWPAGLIGCFPKEMSANGTVVIDKGDVNISFKRYVESPVTLRVENDFIVAIEGEGVDTELFRSYIAGTGDEAAYAHHMLAGE